MNAAIASRGGEESTVVESRFIAERNALLVSGDFAAVFMEFYLHLGATGVVLRDGTDEMAKRSLAALALYGATRPRNETLAWTLHFEAEELNIFVCADLSEGSLVGRVFAKNVRHGSGNVLYAETAGPRAQRRRSSVDFTGNDALRAAERFFRQSEQRPGKFFYLGGDKFAALAAQPDCDTEWLESAGTEEVSCLATDPARRLLEARHYAFCCGCTPRKIAAAIGATLQGKLDEIYGGDSHINVDCPRCGLRHELSRDLFV